MANLLRGECDLEVKDRTYRLVFDQNAVCELEAQLLPEEFYEVASRWQQDKWSSREIRAMLFSGMQRNHPKMTLQQCGDILSILTPREVLERILPAFVKALPKPDVQETDQGNGVADDGTGTASLRPPAPVG